MTAPAPRLLRLDASSRAEGSHSRRLADGIEAHWRRSRPDGTVVRRDLGAAPPPAIAAATIQGFYTPADQLTPALQTATALSDTLIDELRAADVLLVATPMYNFGPPAALKAWVDQVVRAGHTFGWGAEGLHGMLRTPLAVLALASGVPGSLGGPNDFLGPYLEAVLRFVGVQRIATVRLDGTSGAAEQVDAALEGALREARALFT
jgi:FMN-dependent NADH-azoreductase